MVEQIDHEGEVDGIVGLPLGHFERVIATRFAFEFGEIAKRERRVALQPHLVLQGDAARSQCRNQDEGINHGGGLPLRGGVRRPLGWIGCSFRTAVGCESS